MARSRFGGPCYRFFPEESCEHLGADSAVRNEPEPCGSSIKMENENGRSVIPWIGTDGSAY